MEILDVSPGAKIGRIKKTICTIVNDDGTCPVLGSFSLFVFVYYHCSKVIR